MLQAKLGNSPKGTREEIAAAQGRFARSRLGHAIRSYVFYDNRVKDHRTGVENSNYEAVLRAISPTSSMRSSSGAVRKKAARRLVAGEWPAMTKVNLPFRLADALRNVLPHIHVIDAGAMVLGVEAPPYARSSAGRGTQP